ncbi:DUF4123 domain-containing protein [Hafnia paralvei]|uniref:DUF4123 domain-containing protein n=1 Tax=Hafnia paralvei TaxID=546367 RepID=UPI001CC93CA8|nr:DUF4123 domain-containing protein [Hafnia paralvei]UBM41646.1 DUF4123 domain-containing protein [Hafnia paralvei]
MSLRTNKRETPNALNTQELKAALCDFPIYLLLQPRIIEHLTYNGLQKHDDVFPPAPSLIEIIKQSDPYILYHWIWEDTRYDREREKGPLLIEVTENAATLEQFIALWGQHHAGLIIHSTNPIDELVSHLAAVSTLVMSNGHCVRFNWLPNSLDDILSALTAKKRDRLIGPLQNVYYYHSGNSQHPWRKYQSQYRETLFSPVLKLTSREIKRISLAKHQKSDALLARELLICSDSTEEHYPRALQLVKTCQHQLQKFNIQRQEHVQRFIHTFFAHMIQMNHERSVCVLANLQQPVVDRLDALDYLIHNPLGYFTSEYFYHQLMSDWLLIPENKQRYFYDATNAVLTTYRPPEQNVSESQIREQFLQSYGTSIQLAKHIVQNNLPPLSVRREAQRLLSGDLFYGNH